MDYQNNHNPVPNDNTDISFSYDSYLVVGGEFFSHLYEPSVTFNNCKFYVNAVFLKKMPDVDYVQIHVNPEVKKGVKGV